MAIHHSPSRWQWVETENRTVDWSQWSRDFTDEVDAIGGTHREGGARCWEGSARANDLRHGAILMLERYPLLMATFEKRNPVNGEFITEHHINSSEDVANALHRARAAAKLWSAMGYRARKKILLRWCALLLERSQEIKDLVSLETGKPLSDAQLEVVLATHHLGWAARNAERILSPSHRNAGLLMANMAAKVERPPLGVVGVIGPWNYPVFTPMGSIAYALAAGNTVLFKPSEFTPGVGLLLADTFAQVAPFDGILQTLTGLGETGKALCESGVDKVAFTGSTRTAKKVAQACGALMVPVVLECGGKDPVIVDKDADLARAADGAIWSAMANAGQSCIGAERVYVHEKVADRFIAECVKLAQALTPGAPGTGNYGPATMPKQLDIIRSHISDAIKRGGTVALGSEASVGKEFVQPVIITDVPEDSTAITDETFGPTLVINRVKSMDQAVSLSNASSYGLGAAVWSKKNGRKIASQLHCGMVAINSTFSYAAVSTVPFGGVKDSGYGRIHGPEGLLEFTYPRTVMRARFQLPISFTSFKRTPFLDKVVFAVTRALKGRA